MATADKSVSRVEVDEDGSVVAFADVERTEGADAATARLHVEGGHRPPGTGARLIDAVLQTPAVKEAGAVIAAVPKGDGEAIETMQQRLPSATTRSAGSTVIVEAEVPRDGD
jgi:hypothetical protein